MPGVLRIAIVGVVLAVGCRERALAPPTPTEAKTAPPASSAQASAQQILDGMDARRPVALLPMMANHQKQNMRAHLVAVQDIVAGLAADDFAAVEKAAGAIGFSEQMGQMCTHMGAAAPGFTPLALEFHHTADTIVAAARKKDSRAVLEALHATLAACTGCHAAYKQRVVDEATWGALAGQAPPQQMHAQ